MKDKKDFIERRRSDRFKIMDGAFAAIKSDDYIVGPIQNISKDGLTFRYLGKSGQIQTLIEADIFFSGMGFYIENLKLKCISDFRIDKKASNSSLSIRQCGMQFRELTNNQTSQINNFIQEFAERRLAEDRRGFSSSQYMGPERRKGVERRKMIDRPF
jgi:hypothetical protein